MLGETTSFERSLEELGFLPGNLEPEIDFGLWVCGGLSWVLFV